MLRIKEHTLLGFLFSWVGAFFLIVVISSALIISYVCSHAEHDSVQGSLLREIGRASRLLDSGEAYTDEDIDKNIRMEDCHLVVLKTDGTFVRGEYPSGWERAAHAAPAGKHGMYTVDSQEGQLYVTERIHRTRNSEGHAEDRERIIIRAITYRKHTDDVYRTIRNYSLIAMLILSVILVIAGYLVYRKISRPLKEMVTIADQISKENSYLGRMPEAPFSEIRSLTAAFNRLFERNQRLIEQQEEFNANVSHELRTPVALIRSECELINDYYAEQMSEDMKRSVDVINAQTIRMNSMIRELMYLSKADTEDELQNTEVIDVAEILASVCDDADYLMKGKRKFDCSFAPAQANVDLTLIMIAVRNLVSNAIKYSGEGSVIRVTDACDDECIYISVTDEGIGISEQDIDKVFDYYYQVSGWRNSDGFGLGLTLARKIARKHRGDITVKSELGRGSTFTLTLPRAREN